MRNATNRMNPNDQNNSSQGPDMGRVYDEFADAFRKADELPTWKYVGKPGMENLLRPYLRPGMTFLDFGSASARVEVGVLLPGGVRPGDITGVEISPDQVAMAQARIPEATFVVGNVADTSLLADRDGTYDVVFSHMVFEHLDDAQLADACRNAYRLLKAGGTFAFIVTHPDKMTDINGNLVKEYGAFETTAPWGGVLHNYRRSVDETIRTKRDAGFDIEITEELKFPQQAPAGLDPRDQAIFAEHAQKYSRYPAIRLAMRSKKK